MSELDRILDQRGMNSLKWEFTVRNGEPEVWKETDPELGEEQVLSMWVADMDFRTAEPVIPVSYTHLTLPTILLV